MYFDRVSNALFENLEGYMYWILCVGQYISCCNMGVKSDSEIILFAWRLFRHFVRYPLLELEVVEHARWRKCTTQDGGDALFGTTWLINQLINLNLNYLNLKCYVCNYDAMMLRCMNWNCSNAAFLGCPRTNLSSSGRSNWGLPALSKSTGDPTTNPYILIRIQE